MVKNNVKTTHNNDSTISNTNMITDSSNDDITVMMMIK